MKKYLYILFFPLLVSCSSTYFLSTLSSNSEDVEQVENGDFLIEKDSLWIAYCFNGESAPIQITVFNKSSQPLYVDWQKSALIVNDVAFTYGGEKLEMGGNVNGYFIDDMPMLYNSVGEFQGDFRGNINLPKYVSFIPPNTMISHKPLRLTGVDLEVIPKKEYKNMLMTDKNDQTVKVKQVNFEEENTPLKFRSYLTVYAENNKPIVFEQSFYLKNIIKSTSLTPKSMSKELAERGDLFYIEKPANTTFANIFLGTSLVVGAVALDVMVNTNNY
ncbi:hypothetical protein [Dysgonomonas sp. ZJ279]|uniref:hypothetical protein n=1 Tax=Dysgonomonas sp. ZJ279 TaxID=2709796 RepID=UPI0013EAA40C|nr:hypothetical protein [Dysgonomonas sp. ZJ279]